MQFAGRPLEEDVSPGKWIAASVRDSLADVGSLLPPGFAACARVFHPAVRYPDGGAPGPMGAIVAPLPPDEDVSWAEIAAANGRTAHPGMEWIAITGSWDYLGQNDQPGLWNDAPAQGHLPSVVAERLIAVLARHTATPDDCFFGLWSGSGVVADAPTLALPHREYWVVRGPIDLAAANLAEEPSEQSANLWWPADRAWCVATDIDLMATYVGGSADCIADVLAAEGLETAPVTADQGTCWDADTVNPTPPRG